MKERGILFSAPMVRALLAGTKTQTRRVVKWRDVDAGLSLSFSGLRAYGYAQGWVLESDSRTSTEWRCKPTPCPYGQLGDRLWVRETFAGSIAYERHGYPLKDWGNKLWYVADGEPRSGQWTRPRPSIHMPRALSRITLEVTGVRVERLQDISEADAQAEGVDPADEPNQLRWQHYSPHGVAYARLWDDINGPGSWDANPWVWVVEFKRVAPA